MSKNAPDIADNDANLMSGARRAAVLLLYLGEGISAEVFKRLTDDEVKRISQEISVLGSVPREMTESVLKHTHDALSGHSKVKGSLDYTRKILEQAFSPEIAREYIREISLSSRVNVKGLAILQKSDPMQLSKLLLGEHPQTIALVISHLKPDQAAKTVAQLDEELRADVCIRLAQLEQISQPVRDRVIALLADKLDMGAQYDRGASGGVRQVAEIFNQMERDITQTCLEKIENENPNMALAIRNNMFVFEDLLVVGDRDMRKIIQAIDKQVLVTALKGTNEELKEHFFRNMSARAVEMIKEDMEAMGPIRLRDAELAQQEIVNQVRALEQSGEFDLGASGADEYVS